MDEAAQEAKAVRSNVNFIYAQANAEREKELAFIERMTGFRPSANDWGPNAANIVDAINLCINSKAIYDRAYQTIMAEGQTQGKGVYSFFGGYLQSTLNKEWPAFVKSLDIEKVFEITETELVNWLKQTVLPLAIENMFNAEVEDGVDPNLQTAY